jgi:hypothetical protein
MAQDYLLKFGTLAFSGTNHLANPTLTANTGYSTGTTNLLTHAGGSVVDLGAIGGQNSRSELYVKINVNITAVTGGGTGDYIVFRPLVEASKDGVNYSIVSTLPTDVTALRVAYATATTISGDSSLQAFVPISAPAGTPTTQITITGTSDPRGTQGTVVADDNYRFFRVRIMSNVLGTGANNAPTGSSHTMTGLCSGFIVNAKDGVI